MGQLTTHVLDISAGVPAAGVRIEVHEWPPGSPASPPTAATPGTPGTPDKPGSWGAPATPGGSRLLAAAATGRDGRCGGPLLAGDAFQAGRYAITFYLAQYFRGRGVAIPEPAFLEEAVIRIGIAHPDQHYHVPLLISPWSYSVYRGG